MIRRYNAFARRLPRFRPLSTSGSTYNAAANTRKYVYPEFLLVYNSGWLKTMFIGGMKFMANFSLVVLTLGVLPMHMKDAETWKIVRAIGFGTVPIVTLGVLTAPYVHSVFVRLPPTARLSKAALFRWASTARPSTEIQFTALRVSGLRRTTYTTLEHLYPLREKWGRMANLVRVGGDRPQTSLRGILDKGQSKFYIGGPWGIKRSKAPGVWNILWAGIQKKPVKD